MNGGRIALAILGFVLAWLSGVAAAIAALLFDPRLWSTLIDAVMQLFDRLQSEGAYDFDPLAQGAAILRSHIVAPTLVLGLAVIVGEVARIRSYIVWGPGLALLFLAIPTLLEGIGRGASTTAPTPGSVMLFVAGLAAGSVYWAVAGRSAGGGGERPQISLDRPR